MNTLNSYLQISVNFLQLIFIVIGYKIGIKQFRMSKSANYLERFLSSEMTEARNTVDVIFIKRDLQDILSHLSKPENINQINHVRMFANFFQELGVAYQNKLVDKKYTKDVFDFLSDNYWHLMLGWICDYRNKANNQSLYSKWEILKTKLNPQKL
jgi:hypothetical protein